MIPRTVKDRTGWWEREGKEKWRENMSTSCTLLCIAQMQKDSISGF